MEKRKSVFIILLLSVLVIATSIQAVNPTITVNSPSDRQDFSYGDLTNITFTLTDGDSDDIDVEVFLGTTENLNYTTLIYKNNTIPSGSQIILNATPLPYWDYDNSSRVALMLKFDNISSLGENLTHFIDYSPNGNNGSNVNSPEIVSDSKFGQGLFIEDTNSYISVPYSSSLNLQETNWTMAMWIKPQNIGDDTMHLISQENGDATGRVFVGIDTDGNLSTISCGPVQPLANIVPTTIVANEWQHIAISNDNNTINAYIDGVLVGQQVGCSDQQTNPNGNFRIGNNKNTAKHYNGTIDDLLIVRNVLTQTEIQALYNTSALPNSTYYMNISVVDSSSEVSSSTQKFYVGGFCNLANFGEPFVTAVTNNSALMSFIFSDDVDFQINYSNTSGTYNFSTGITSNVPKNDSAEDTLTGLWANSTIYYQGFIRPNGTTNDFCAVYSGKNFTTTKPKGETFIFDFVTDSHFWAGVVQEVSGLPDWNNSMDGVRTTNPDFIVDGGDTAMPHMGSLDGEWNANHNTSADNRYISTRNEYTRAINSVPIYMTNGNHEGEFSMGAFNDHNDTLLDISEDARLKYWPGVKPDVYPYNGSLDLNNGTSDYLENYYAFDFGDATFVILDSYRYSTGDGINGIQDDEEWTLGQTQFEWLESTLNKSDKKWKLLFAHHIIGGADSYKTDSYAYGDGGGRQSQSGNTSYGQVAINKIMEEYNAQAYVYGHIHHFAHDWANWTNYSRENYTNYILSSTLTQEPCVSANRIALYDNEFCERGFTRFTVSPNNITFNFINASGSYIYNYTLQNTAPIINITYANQSTITSSLNFYYNDTEYDRSKNCEVFVNGVSQYSNSTSMADSNISVALTDLGLSNGENFNWYVSCSDGALSSTSETFNAQATINNLIDDSGNTGSTGTGNNPPPEDNQTQTDDDPEEPGVIKEIKDDIEEATTEIIRIVTNPFDNPKPIIITILSILGIWLIISIINKNNAKR